MKIALVHDWLRVNAGSEKVVSGILDEYRDDEVSLYTLFNHLSAVDKDEIVKNVEVNTSLLQHLPRIHRYYRYLLPLMPMIIRGFYLSDYDVIISSSHAVAKGFRRSKNIPHICYCHTPMRYAWDLYEDYSNDSSKLKSFIYKLFVKYIRKWDYNTAKNVDFFIANSQNVKKRIEINYGRPAKVIYPPVRTGFFTLCREPRRDFYLCPGRFVGYKKIDVVINAFKEMRDKKLLLVGDGYDAPKITKLLQHVPNVTWLGYKGDEELLRLMQQAKACVFAAKEDFGIMCVEAQACGTPVIALNNGGYKETVIDGVTGYLFEEQTKESVQETIHKFEAAPLEDFEAIRANAEQFSDVRFKEELSTYLRECMTYFYHGKIVNERTYSLR